MMTWNEKCQNEKCQLEDDADEVYDEAYFSSPEWAKSMEMVNFHIEYPTLKISESHTIYFVSDDEWEEASKMPNFWDMRP